MSLSSIGKIFGQDHTTVNYAIQMKLQQKYYWDPAQTIWGEYDELIKF
jgi:chromosomal replication initiation ATPase DnaA